MPGSHEDITNTNPDDQSNNPQNIPNDHEVVDSNEDNRILGAKILSQSNYESRHKDIVESSFNRARKKDERLSGNNAERRNYAYLSRINNLVSKYGNKLEKKLWDASTGKLIIKPENITEQYWKTQEQILRDNGQGRKLSDYEKEILTDDIIKHQKESLESWSNYLGDKNSPYPMWFKVYAWDGMSKMGVFDKEKQQFAKRDATTVAPYPKLNPAVLAKTYAAITDFYDSEDSWHKNRQSDTEINTKNVELNALVKSGNFNKLYSKILLSEKVIPKTPERTEDIHGEWIEYLPGEEEKLANAAEGTPWCVADPGTGRNYLEYGNYEGHAEDDDYDEHHDNDNKAKFILFHLYDPKTNTLSGSACASVRLDPNGRVAEISGLNEGQALEDSLVPIVKEKVMSLPGGEDFLEAFADKQELIRLDHKIQNNEDLSKEELDFVYEINRPIHVLDTYNINDPRIDELREKYGIEYALGHGVDVNDLVSQLGPWQIADDLDTLISHGANIDVNDLVSQLGPKLIANNLDTLISHGANIDVNDLVSWLAPKLIADNLDTLISHGANIDVNDLVSQLGPWQIADDLDTLISHGVNIDVNDLVSQLVPWQIADNLDTLISHGANIDVNDLVSQLEPWEIADDLDTLISHGANANQIKSKLDEANIEYDRDLLH